MRAAYPGRRPSRPERREMSTEREGTVMRNKRTYSFGASKALSLLLAVLLVCGTVLPALAEEGAEAPGRFSKLLIDLREYPADSGKTNEVIIETNYSQVNVDEGGGTAADNVTITVQLNKGAQVMLPENTGNEDYTYDPDSGVVTINVVQMAPGGAQTFAFSVIPHPNGITADGVKDTYKATLTYGAEKLEATCESKMTAQMNYSLNDASMTSQIGGATTGTFKKTDKLFDLFINYSLSNNRLSDLVGTEFAKSIVIKDSFVLPEEFWFNASNMTDNNGVFELNNVKLVDASGNVTTGADVKATFDAATRTVNLEISIASSDETAEIDLKGAYKLKLEGIEVKQEACALDEVSGVTIDAGKVTAAVTGVAGGGPILIEAQRNKAVFTRPGEVIKEKDDALSKTISKRFTAKGSKTITHTGSDIDYAGSKYKTTEEFELYNFKNAQEEALKDFTIADYRFKANDMLMFDSIYTGNYLGAFGGGTNKMDIEFYAKDGSDTKFKLIGTISGVAVKQTLSRGDIKTALSIDDAAFETVAMIAFKFGTVSGSASGVAFSCDATDTLKLGYTLPRQPKDSKGKPVSRLTYTNQTNLYYTYDYTALSGDPAQKKYTFNPASMPADSAGKGFAAAATASVDYFSDYANTLAGWNKTAEKVTPGSDKSVFYPGDTIKYTLKIDNTSSSADMGKPIVVTDYLSKFIDLTGVTKMTDIKCTVTYIDYNKNKTDISSYATLKILNDLATPYPEYECQSCGFIFFDNAAYKTALGITGTIDEHTTHCPVCNKDTTFVKNPKHTALQWEINRDIGGGNGIEVTYELKLKPESVISQNPAYTGGGVKVLNSFSAFPKSMPNPGPGGNGGSWWTGGSGTGWRVIETKKSDVVALGIKKEANVGAGFYTADPTAANAKVGQEVEFKITARVSSEKFDSADAFDPVILDILPANLEYIPGSVTFGTTGVKANGDALTAPLTAAFSSAPYTDSSVSPSIDCNLLKWKFSDLRLRSSENDTITITYKAKVLSIDKNATVAGTGDARYWKTKNAAYIAVKKEDLKTYNNEFLYDLDAAAGTVWGKDIIKDSGNAAGEGAINYLMNDVKIALGTGLKVGIVKAELSNETGLPVSPGYKLPDGGVRKYKVTVSNSSVENESIDLTKLVDVLPKNETFKELVSITLNGTDKSASFAAAFTPSSKNLLFTAITPIKLSKGDVLEFVYTATVNVGAAAATRSKDHTDTNKAAFYALQYIPSTSLISGVASDETKYLNWDEDELTTRRYNASVEVYYTEQVLFPGIEKQGMYISQGKKDLPLEWSVYSPTGPSVAGGNLFGWKIKVSLDKSSQLSVTNPVVYDQLTSGAKFPLLGGDCVKKVCDDAGNEIDFAVTRVDDHNVKIETKNYTLAKGHYFTVYLICTIDSGFMSTVKNDAYLVMPQLRTPEGGTVERIDGKTPGAELKRDTAGLEFDRVRIDELDNYALKASAYVDCISLLGIGSLKTVYDNEDPSEAVKKANNGDYLVLEAGGTYSYTLDVSNNGTYTFKGMTIVDKLPQIGDTGVVLYGDKDKRDSQFDIVLLGVDIPGLAKDKYTVMYGKHAATAAITDSAIWDGTSDAGFTNDIKDATTFRVVVDKSFTLTKGQSLRVLVTFKIKDDTKPGIIAWNSFGYQTWYDKSGVDEQIRVEPIKVGITVRDKKDGKLDVEKTFIPVEGGVLKDQTFSFTVRDAADKKVGDVTLEFKKDADDVTGLYGDFTKSADGKSFTANTKDLGKTLTGLAFGKYTVEEDTTGLTLTDVYADSYTEGTSTPSSKTAAQELANGSTATFKFWNVESSAWITIKKLQKAGSGVWNDTEFKFNVYKLDAEGNRTGAAIPVTVSAPSWSKTIPVEPGTYEIVEDLTNTLGVYNPAPVYDYGTEGAVSVTVVAGEEAKVVTVTNEALGSLKITKTLVGEEVTAEDGKTFKFDIYSVSDTLKPVKSEVELTIAAGQTNATVTVPNLPCGDYIVKETTTGYYTTYKVGNDPASDNPLTIKGTVLPAWKDTTVEGQDNAVEFIVTNMLTELIVRKTVSGGDASEKTFDFTLKNETTGVTTAFSIKVTGPATESKTIYSLKPGDTYSITETAYSGFNTTYSVDGAAYTSAAPTFTLTTGKTVTVDVLNTKTGGGGGNTPTPSSTPTTSTPTTSTPTTSTPGRTTPGRTTPTPLTDITDPNTPSGGGTEDFENLDNPNPPLGGLPSAGGLPLAALLSVLGIGGVVAGVLVGRRKKEDGSGEIS